MVLRPDLDMHSAARRGVEVFPYASDLRPEAAADMYYLSYARSLISAHREAKKDPAKQIKYLVTGRSES